jgi:hypothetical protein
MPEPTMALYFMSLIETRSSIFVMPSQCRESGMSSCGNEELAAAMKA